MIFEEIDNNKNFVFVIDGDYFMNRIAFAMGLDFIENPEQDANEYLKSLAFSLSRLILDYKDAISKVIMVRDAHSWRKDITMLVNESNKDMPFEKQQYKANRNKDEAIIDMKVVANTFDIFIERMEEEFNIPLLRNKNSEGDDWLAYVSKKEIEKGNNVLLYTSDGDSHMLVEEKCYILKQMPRDVPNKLVVTQSNLKSYFPNEIIEVDDDDPLRIFGNDKSPKKFDNLIKYFKYEDLMIATPSKILLLKAISGDKKDNIFPTFEWTSADKNGQIKVFKPTSMYIKKGLDSLDILLDDVTMDMIFDKDFYTKLLLSVLKKSPLTPKLVDIKRAYKTKLTLDKDYIKSIEKEPFNREYFIEFLRKIIFTDGVFLNGETVKLTDEIFNKTLDNMNEPFSIFKDIKNNEKIVNFLECLRDNYPIMRDFDRIVKVYEQNLKMLHLNEKSIPKYVYEQMDYVYKIKGNVTNDISVISNHHALLGSLPNSDKVFDNIDDDENFDNLDSVTDDDVDSLLGDALGIY